MDGKEVADDEDDDAEEVEMNLNLRKMRQTIRRKLAPEMSVVLIVVVVVVVVIQVAVCSAAQPNRTNSGQLDDAYLNLTHPARSSEIVGFGPSDLSDSGAASGTK